MRRQPSTSTACGSAASACGRSSSATTRRRSIRDNPGPILPAPLMDFAAVLFDCDGVLVDSETITNGVLRDMLAELGWSLTLDECMRRFVGKSLKHETAYIQAHTGHAVGDDWLAQFRARRDARLAREVQPIRGAVDA